MTSIDGACIKARGEMRTKGMLRRVRGWQGERLAVPEDDWLRECVREVKSANPDFGVKRVLTALREER